MKRQILYSLLFMILILPIKSRALIEPVAVDIYSGVVSVANSDVKIIMQSDPLSLAISYSGSRRLYGPEGKIFAFQSDGMQHYFVRAEKIYRRFQGFVADIVTADGRHGQLLINLDAKGHIRIELLPPENATAVQINLTQKSDEHFYGLGDLWDTKSVDAKGYRVEMWDHAGTPDVCNDVPFFMSTAGYGIFVDCAYRGYFDFGKANPKITTMRFEASNLSLHIWLGDSFRDILPQYLNLTGYPPLPPDWVFLPQKWRDEGTWDDVFKDVKMFREHDIPLGAIWIDRPWMQGAYGADDYIFDQKRYPDAKEKIAELHKMGVRVLVWACDFLTPESKYFREGMKKGYFILNEDEVKAGKLKGHVIVDFANPDAREWFKKIIKNAFDYGIDGIKLDRGQSYPLDIVPPSGRDPLEMHNYHAYLMVKTFAEVLKEERGDDFQFTPRAGWAGTQAWSVKWPGDLDSDFSLDKGLPAIIRAQSAAALTGFAFWGSDMGGYGRKLSKTCFIRWMQHSTFSPLMEMGGKGDHLTIPFSWDEETTRITRFYAKLRVNMLPYIKAMAKKAHEKGFPLVRHLVWDWPQDPNVHSHSYEYMFGDDLLIAPVIDEKNSRQVYLPEGQWIDFWNRARVLTGPQTIDEKVPLERIPVYIRKGAGFDFKLPTVK